MNYVKTILAFAFIFAILSGLSAQENTKEEPVYNQFKNEIGIDFQNLFSFNTLGSSLVFKKRIGEKRFISLNEKRVLRFQTGFFVDNSLAIDTASNNYSYFMNRYAAGDAFKDKNINSRILVGMEWQKQKGRWQFFYGFDIGVGYSIADRITGYYYQYSGNVIINEGFITSKEESLNFPTYGFFGLKYFFTPRVSLSVESAISAGFSKIKSNETRHSSIEKTSEETFLIKELRINSNFDYLRFLNLSYYFD
ncbi:MAG TPA: hypothetical protein PKC40_00865 [Saprospiraceae bacterium]|nr:hypothetical protein [Saprospiraceae bacterium]